MGYKVKTESQALMLARHWKTLCVDCNLEKHGELWFVYPEAFHPCWREVCDAFIAGWEAALKAATTPPTDRQGYLTWLLRHAITLPEDGWDNLPEAARRWAKRAHMARQQGKPLPEFQDV